MLRLVILLCVVGLALRVPQSSRHGFEFAFERYEPNIVSNLALPYEYTSWMHYTSHAFSRNGLPTITPLKCFSGVMSQLENVTTLDWFRLSRLYNCPGAWNDDEIEVLDKSSALLLSLKR